MTFLSLTSFFSTAMVMRKYINDNKIWIVDLICVVTSYKLSGIKQESKTNNLIVRINFKDRDEQQIFKQVIKVQLLARNECYLLFF